MEQQFNVQCSMHQRYRVVQIGCGVVGKAYVSAYQNKNCSVVGIEASQKLVDLYKNEMEIYHINDDISDVSNVDFIMISICTPLKDDKLDLSYLFSSIKNVSVLVKNSPNAFVVIRSTVPPTTTRKYKSLLEADVGFKVNVLFQPEFLRAVSAVEDALNPWYVVCGVEPDLDTSKLMDLYSRFIRKDLISFCTIEEAELLKVFHNSYNAAKISFTNQADLLCKAISKMENTTINTETIFAMMVKTCEGLKNSKYGTKPGHAYYGTCLPKDSAELASLEKRYGLEVPLFDSVVCVNNVVKRSDKTEVLNGDHHVSFECLKGDNYDSLKKN